MKVLFIGGTGTISYSSTLLAKEKGIDLYLLNRGKSELRPIPEGVRLLKADIRDPNSVAEALGTLKFDAVADFIAFTPEHIETDLALFRGKTGQYLFISSASAYQTPPSTLPVTESTLLDNPAWEYSRNKIACEERLARAYREEKFPFTIVRPSHTYDQVYIPVHGGWTVVDRMLRGLPVIVHGDGSSLWTLTHSSDFAKGFVGLLGNSHAIGEVYHITSDEWLTWDQIHQVIAKALGVDARIVHVPSDLIAAYDADWGDSLLGDKTHSFVLDNSKIKKAVPGFACTKPFSVGIQESLDWYHADPDRQVVDGQFNALCERILAAYAKAWPN
ncbi:MAG TPA: SDR family oxidoreductase, partial [Anaerolineaceae bacterium]|nr:SDR family oxidoreductase [Anaerolineaceae bacterium]